MTETFPCWPVQRIHPPPSILVRMRMKFLNKMTILIVSIHFLGISSAPDLAQRLAEIALKEKTTTAPGLDIASVAKSDSPESLLVLETATPAGAETGGFGSSPIWALVACVASLAFLLACLCFCKRST